MALERVGFVGLGDQGGPMARRIAEAGFPTTVWARRAATLEPYADVPFTEAGSAAAVGAACDIACVCVVDDDGVLAVSAELLEGLAPGAVLVVHSTVHPDTVRTVAERARGRGVAVVDAPVSGGGAVALEGRLLVMAGGAEPDVERCRPVFATYADPVLHLGPVGTGQLAKLLNNLLFTAHLAVADAAFALGSALDVDAGGLAEVLRHGSARSYGVEVVANAGFDLATVAPVAGPLLAKDTRIAEELATAAGHAERTLFAAAHHTLRRMGQPAT